MIDRTPSGFSNDDVLPVECVSWFDAVSFCNELSSKEGLHPFFKIDGDLIEIPDWDGPGYRLPTEAEWEYACRAGSTTRYYFGDDEELLHQYAWHNDNSNHRTHPVGEKKPNRFGLYDMNGNVSEWCWDWFESGYRSLEETHRGTRGTQIGDARILRGGSYRGDKANICSALRLRESPSGKDTNIWGSSCEEPLKNVWHSSTCNPLPLRLIDVHIERKITLFRTYIMQARIGRLRTS